MPEHNTCCFVHMYIYLHGVCCTEKNDNPPRLFLSVVSLLLQIFLLFTWVCLLVICRGRRQLKCTVRSVGNCAQVNTTHTFHSMHTFIILSLSVRWKICALLQNICTLDAPCLKHVVLWVSIYWVTVLDAHAHTHASTHARTHTHTHTHTHAHTYT